MRKIYVKPDTTIVNVGTSVETMAGALELPVSNISVSDEASKEQGIVDTEEELPIAPDIWSTDED